MSGEVDNVVKATCLPDTEMQEIRQIIARAKGEAEAARIEYHEKLSSLRSEARWTLKSLLDKCRTLKEYTDAKYVGHKRGNTILILPEGKAVGFGFAGHASGEFGYFHKTFEFWGFEGPWELLTLPKEVRDEFFDRAIAFVEGIFGKDVDGLERLLTSVDLEEDPVQLKLLQLKAEDMTTETRTALMAIACSIKAKAEAEERRSLHIRLRKRLTAARFYLEQHLSY
jgi:hypothetical protein